MIRRAVCRAGQFVRALTAPLAEENLEDVGRALAPAQRTLFLRMRPVDRRHALAVYRALRRRGPQPADLLAAALLHDVGKAAVPLPLWVRVAVVLLEAFAPRLLERLGTGWPRGWRRHFVAARRHAEVGAALAAEAGCSRVTVSLIRRHHRRPEGGQAEEDRLLALLREADARS